MQILEDQYGQQQDYHKHVTVILKIGSYDN